MCGSQENRLDRPSFDFVARPILDHMDSLLRFNGPERNRDEQHIRSIEWAFSMLRSGHKVRKKSWPSNHYAFLYRKNGKLYGNTLIIDEHDLRKLSEPFSTLVLRADASDDSCGPMEDFGDINAHDWALYE